MTCNLSMSNDNGTASCTDSYVQDEGVVINPVENTAGS